MFQAILRIRIRNQQINTAIDKFISEEKRNPVGLTESKEGERVISFDVSNISDIISPDQVCVFIKLIHKDFGIDV